MSAPARPRVPAAFWRRYAAWSIDMALLLGVALAASAARIHDAARRFAAALDALAGMMARDMADLLLHGATPLGLARRWLEDPQGREAVAALSGAASAAVLPPLLLGAVLALAWFTLFESSRWRATPGKRLLRLQVCGEDGTRVGPRRAAMRHLAGTLSWLTLNLGHALALVPPRRQALHDRISRTQVVQDEAGDRLPAWALAWLVVQAVAVAAATAWLFLSTQAAMARAFDALL